MAAEEAFQVSNFKFIIDQILDKRNRKGGQYMGTKSLFAFGCSGSHRSTI
jgi:hypothetical protein